jgi:hypothetical protein
MVCESLACPRISNKAGSDMKKNLGNTSLFFSKYLKIYPSVKHIETSGRSQLRLMETLFRDPSDVALPKFSK